jgi:triacylglycerol lipase
MSGETPAGRVSRRDLAQTSTVMRVHVFGLVGALALAGCGSEGGAPVAKTTPTDPNAPAPSPRPSSSFSFTPPPDAPAHDDDVTSGGAPYPILLLHGMAGFEKLNVGPIDVAYFTGVVDDLVAHGEDAYLTVAPPYDTSEVRAAAIAKQIDDILARTGKAKVNLIGHSQGGLDARVLASPNGLGYADRIASVTTIATPHRGTRVADLALGFIKYAPDKMFDDAVGFVLSLVQRTAYDLKTDSNLRAQVNLLSEKYMTEVFNPKYADSPKVVYTSYAGRTNKETGKGSCDDGVIPNDPKKLDTVTPALLPTAVYLSEKEGETNDGLVSVASAKWGTFEQCVPADHMKEVGMILGKTSFDHLQFFRDIVSRLHKAGF